MPVADLRAQLIELNHRLGGALTRSELTYWLALVEKTTGKIRAKIAEGAERLTNFIAAADSAAQ